MGPSLRTPVAGSRGKPSIGPMAALEVGGKSLLHHVSSYLLLLNLPTTFLVTVSSSLICYGTGIAVLKVQFLVY